jgi:hypothetical protein
VAANGITLDNDHSSTINSKSHTANDGNRETPGGDMDYLDPLTWSDDNDTSSTESELDQANARGPLDEEDEEDDEDDELVGEEEEEHEEDTGKQHSSTSTTLVAGSQLTSTNTTSNIHHNTDATMMSVDMD